MAAILRHIPDQTAFDPVAIEAMAKALEEACAALHIFAGDEAGRSVIATRVVDLARNGVIEADALRDRVLAEAHLSI